ncbi:MAG: M23 family metallopeptidase, partial [Nitrososphaerales archaeon]
MNPIYPVDKKWEFKSKFGERPHRSDSTKTELHLGDDIPAPEGTPIKSMMPGTVIYAGARTGYGNVVVIKSEDGTRLYAHMKDGSISKIKKGDEVKQGNQIGEVGHTGETYGKDGLPHNHLHVEKINSKGTELIEGKEWQLPGKKEGGKIYRMDPTDELNKARKQSDLNLSEASSSSSVPNISSLTPSVSNPTSTTNKNNSQQPSTNTAQKVGATQTQANDKKTLGEIKTLFNQADEFTGSDKQKEETINDLKHILKNISGDMQEKKTESAEAKSENNGTASQNQKGILVFDKAFIEDAQAVAQLVGKFGGMIKSDELIKLATIVQNGLQIAGILTGCLTGMAGGPVVGVAVAVLNIIGCFLSSGPSPEQIILDRLNDIAKQIEGVSK